MPKRAPEKMGLAWWLRRRTTVSWRWLSERLGMGHYTGVTQAVNRTGRRPGWKLSRIKRKQARLEAANPVGTNYNVIFPGPHLRITAGPKGLDWERCLGPAAYRPYHPAYVPGNWRAWCDFGIGSPGDPGCHILDAACWAMKNHKDANAYVRRKHRDGWNL